MDHSSKGRYLISRRDALKKMAGASGAALVMLPEHWEKPLIEVGALPQHAQTSLGIAPFSNTVDVRIEENGEVYDNFTWFEDQGWVGIAVDPSIETADAKGKRPWRRLRRRRNVGPPFWSAGPLIVYITFKFIPVDSSEPLRIPTGNIFCYGYGRFGGTVFNGVIEENISNGQVVIAFPLPANFVGFFFFSCLFPSFIELENGEPFNTEFYCGPCLYGPRCPFADDDDEDDIDDEVENKYQITLANFKITFKGVTYSGNQSTWTYNVEQLSSPPELSKWVLELPLLDCVQIDSSSSGGVEVSPDQDSGLIGIEWQVGGGFTTEDFVVTTSGNSVVGLVDVAVKGDDGIVRIGQISGPVCQEPQVTVTLDCYRILFLEAIDNGDGTSTWRYQVEELACAQDLSNWVLALPFNCTTIVDASPNPWEQVVPDPNANLNGIKWQTGAGFVRAIFEVTLQGTLGTDLGIGVVDVAVKGPDVATGRINGPVCL